MQDPQVDTVAPAGATVARTSHPNGQQSATSDQAAAAMEQGQDQGQTSAQVQDKTAQADGKAQAIAFLKRDDVPNELLPMYDEMNKKFTQGMQAASKAEQDASNWNSLMADRDFVEWYNWKFLGARPPAINGNGGNGGNGHADNSQAPQAQNATPAIPEDLDLTDPAALHSFIAQATAQAFKKMYDANIQPIVQTYVSERVNTERENLRRAYPDFVTYERQVDQLLNQGKAATALDAYKLLTYDKMAEVGKRSYQEQVSRLANMQTADHSALAGSNTAPRVTKRMSINQAAVLAAKNLGMNYNGR